MVYGTNSGVSVYKLNELKKKKAKEKLKYINVQKSPGPDTFKPIMFKYLPKYIIEIIKFIYKACLALHYTPRQWKESTVVFIPKQGKENYQQAKSYRPISLSNSLLKGLEKHLVEQMDLA